MHILIDMAALRMVAAATTRKWANLVEYVDFPRSNIMIVDSMDGRTWSLLSADQIATIYKNMSGAEAPHYGEALKQLRDYAGTWPSYPKSESALEREAEAIYAKEQAEKTPEDLQQEVMREVEQRRGAHQATISTVEAANAALSPEQRQAAAQAITPDQKEARAPAEPAAAPRQGITKRIWEIADELLAVTGQIGNIKEFRTTVIERAVAEGANNGTAATQFLRWKNARGL